MHWLSYIEQTKKKHDDGHEEWEVQSLQVLSQPNLMVPFYVAGGNTPSESGIFTRVVASGALTGRRFPCGGSAPPHHFMPSLDTSGYKGTKSM